MSTPAVHKKSAAIFLDRDGTLMEEVEYCGDPAKVCIFPGVSEALQRLKAAGFRNVIITNQSGIGRGYFTEAQYQLVHARLLELLGPESIDGAYFCPDVPPAPSTRRKPSPAMVFEAAEELGIDLNRSWFIGDKAIDVQCGRNAGVRPILVQTGYGRQEKTEGAVYIAKDLVSATEFILQNSDAS